jgi:hypothetical protein
MTEVAENIHLACWGLLICMLSATCDPIAVYSTRLILIHIECLCVVFPRTSSMAQLIVHRDKVMYIELQTTLTLAAAALVSSTMHQLPQQAPSLPETPSRRSDLFHQ